MIKEVIDVGPECQEQFFCIEDYPSFKNQALTVAGISNLQGRYLIQRTLPDMHNVLFTLSGKGAFEVGHIKGECLPGSVLFMPAGTEFEYKTTDGQPWEIVWMLLPSTSIWDDFPSKPQYASSDIGEKLKHVLSQLDNERQHQLAHTLQMSVLLTEQLQILIHRLLHTQSVNSHPLKLIQALIDVENNLEKSWNVDLVAQAANLSRATAQRHCTQLYGMGIMQKITQLRLNRAAALLTMTQLAIAEIANQVGYEEAFNFSTRFKKHFKKTPSSYRAQPND